MSNRYVVVKLMLRILMLTHTITLNFLRKVTIGYTTVHPAAKSGPTDPEINVSLGDQISCSLFVTHKILTDGSV